MNTSMVENGFSAIGALKVAFHHLARCVEIGDPLQRPAGRLSEALCTLSVTEKSARSLPWAIETLE